MKNFLAIALILISLRSLGQNVNVTLSPKHQQKLSEINSGHKRLLKYYKFYKKDSTLLAKKKERKYKQELDSLWKTNRKQERLRRKLARHGVNIPYDTRELDSLHAEFSRWRKISKDSTLTDSVRQNATEQLQVLAVERARRSPAFDRLQAENWLDVDSSSWGRLIKEFPGLDTLSGLFNFSPVKFFEIAEKSLIEQTGMHNIMSTSSPFSELKGLQSFADQDRKYTDTTALRKEAKARALAEVTERFADHVEQLKGPQEQVSKLLSKYRAYSNSNDLRNSVKQTSLKGSPFRERLFIGGNFNIVTTDPFSIDISPQLGYKFNARFYLGAGINCRLTIGDSIKHKYYISPSNSSIKAFAYYDIVKSFFATAEWEKSHISGSGESRKLNRWHDNYFLGVGRKFLVHPKIYVTLTALYNFNGDDDNPIHPRRFQLRAGFQLSELAMKKPKVSYDPNR